MQCFCGCPADPTFIITERVPMRTKVAMFYLVIASVILATCFCLGFSFQREVSLEQKTAEADLIVVGKVEDVESRWDDPNSKSMIYTYVSLSVEEIVKGSSPGKDITIRFSGGVVDGIGAWTGGMPSFRKGDRVLLFLSRDLYSDNFFVLGGAIGKYQISPKNMVESTGKILPEFLEMVRRYIDK
jgi:hypothetical protein